MLSKPTKSFFLLLFIAVGSLYTALILTREIAPTISDRNLSFTETNGPKVKADAIVSTADWKTYTDEKYPLTFKYPTDWTVTTYASPDNTIGYIIILKSPNPSLDHIRVYINKKGYVAMNGLKPEKTTINGTAAITVNDMLVGMRQSTNFITFDLGTSTELLPYFKALLTTVQITK